MEVKRLSSQDVPTPYSKTLEDATIVQAEQVYDVAVSMLAQPALVGNY